MGNLYLIDNKTLGCYCDSPDKEDCHCRVLLELRQKQIIANQKYRIAIIGSRDYNNFDTIYKYLDSKLGKIDSLVSGGCPTGADRACEIYAKNKGLSITIHYPDWNTYGKSAAFIRNKKIAKDCDILIAWQCNNSKGTQNTIDLAKEFGKKVIINKVESDKIAYIRTTPLNSEE